MNSDGSKNRIWHPGDRAKHFKGGEYEVICIAINTEDCTKRIVYNSLETGETWVRSLSEFNSKVDKNKYPDVKQYWRFEKVN